MSYSILLLGIAIPGILGIGLTFCPSNEQDRSSLAAIKNAMSSPQDDPVFCCGEHITCEVSDQGRIKSLYLYMSSRLFPAGSIPREVCSFAKLQSLTLASDRAVSWNDDIPSCLEELTKLEELRIVGYGPVPVKLPAVPRLKSLRLVDVSLTEASFRNIFSSFKELQELSIETDSLSTTIPTTLCSLSNLVALELSSRFTGAIPSCLPLLSRLKHLRLWDTLLEGTVPYLGNFSEMETLDLSGNQLHGPLPGSACNITATIFSLDLSRNHFSSPLPDCFTVIPSLHLQDNQLIGPLPRLINNSVHFDLSSNKLTGPLPEISDASLMVMLSKNDLSGTLSSQKWHKSCGRLEMLDLSNNRLTGSIPESIGNCTALTQLTVHSNAFYGYIPSAIGALRGLKVFTSRNNRLTGVLPPSLGNCSYLYVLDAASNSLSGELGTWIYNLKYLFVLNLGSNRLVGRIPNGVGNGSTQLMAINLSNNKFSGTLPLSFQFFEPKSAVDSVVLLLLLIRYYVTVKEMNLRLYNSIHYESAYLDISGNNIEGIIPEPFGNFSLLGHLDLSRNQLAGEIPRSLGYLQRLQVLDISSNRLMGAIPQELVSIPQLAYFNVSYNHLSGPVPRGAQFNTFTESSYLGNPGLCDFPLSPCNQKHFNTAGERQTAPRSKAHLFMVVAGAATLTSVSFLLLACLRYSWRQFKAQRKPRQSVSIIEGEIRHATQGFREENILGEGGCSTIYRGVMRRNSQPVAVKVFKLSEPTAEQQFITEYNSLRNLRHRNILKLIHCCSENHLKALVFMFMENGSLERQLHELHASNLPWKTRMKVVQGIANALSYLHEDAGSQGPVIHRDVKPANILLDRDMEPHLGDFGIAMNLSMEGSKHWESKFKGSIGYVAPEYGTNGTISTAVDVYSYGIVVLETLTRIRPTSNTLKEISLRSWVESHLVEGRLEEVLDPVLPRKSIAIDAVARIGLLCSHPIPAARPRMGEVAALLRSTIQEP